MLRKFRKEVRSDSPLFYVWHVFCAISLNAWMWSTVFHARDFPITELFDYTFAYSMVLATLCCTILRMLHKSSNYTKAAVTLMGMFYFLKHFAYLSVGRFDYQYNMKANILTGLCSTIIWISWYFVNRHRKIYSKKILVFNVLAGVFLLLELTDFPPLFWVFDAHSLWHLSTVPLTHLFYRWVRFGCNEFCVFLCSI